MRGCVYRSHSFRECFYKGHKEFDLRVVLSERHYDSSYGLADIHQIFADM